MFSFGGIQRSYSFHLFHSDVIPNSLVAVRCPDADCEWVCFKNNPTSDENIIIGSDRLSIVGNGIILKPGETTGWIPAQNVSLFWHKEDDQATQLEYMIIGHATPTIDYNGILLEGRIGYLLQEDRYILTKEV